MEVFVTYWDDEGADLDAVFSTMDKAMGYVDRELERMECFQIQETCALETLVIMRFRYGEDGAEGSVCIQSHIVDEEI